MASDADELIARLYREGVRLWVVGQRIRWRAPGVALAPAVTAQIEELTEELRGKLELLNARNLTPPRVAGAEAVWLPTVGQSVLARMEGALRVSDMRLWSRAVDAAACQRALDQLVERHSILRTRYVMDDNNTLWAVTEPRLAVQIEHHDLSGVEESVRMPEARRATMEIVGRPFAANTGPLLRFALLRLSQAESVSVLTLCHSICDAWSLSVLVKELLQLYHAELTRERARLPPATMAFSEYARIQNEWVESDAAYRHWLYFRALLADARQPMWLPRDRVTPSCLSAGAPTIRGAVGYETLAALRTLARDTPTTMQVCMLASIGALLSYWTGRRDVFVWVMRSGRDGPHLWGAIGLYADSFLLKMRFEGAMSFRDALRGVKDAYIDVLPHARLTPTELMPLIAEAQYGGPYPEAVIINFLPHTAGTQSIENQELLGQPLDWLEWPGRFDDDSPFGFNMLVWEGSDGVRWMIQHKSALFEDTTIERLASGLARLLTAVADDPEIQLDALRGLFPLPAPQPAVAGPV